MHALLLDLAKPCQRKHLKSAAICKNGLIPHHKLMQSAQFLDRLITGTHMQMIGIGELYLCFQLFQILGRDSALDGSRRADIHENRRLNCSVRSLKLTAARTALLFF